jgi:hypothetical protein
MSELAELKRLARMVLAGKVIPESMIAARQQLLAAMVEAGSEKQRVRGDDGSDYGTVSMCGGEPKAKVVDEAAFTRWVAHNRPDEVEEIVTRRVRPAYEKLLLEGATKAGEPIDAEGTLIPGVQIMAGEPYLAARPTETARQRWRQMLDGGAWELPAG